MAASPLWALVLALTIPSQAESPPSEAAVLLSVPRGFEGSLEDTEQRVRQLLGPALKRRSLADEEGSESVAWSAPSWAELPPERRKELRDALTKRWGQAVRFVEPAVTVSAPRPVPRREALAAPADAVAVNLAKTLPRTSAALDRFFDGQTGRAGIVPFDAALAGAPQRPGAVPPAAQLPQGFAPSAAAPPASLPYDAQVRAAAEAAGVDPAVLRALVQAKSGFDPERRGGLTTITPGAAADVGMKGADLSDPETNLRAGALYFAKMLRAFRGDTHRALAAYQAGPGAVLKSGGIPNRADVKSLLAAYERAYRQPQGGVPRPAVKPVRPPVAAARMTADAVVSLAVRDPKDPTSKYRPLVDKHAAKHGVDADLVMAIMRRENPWGDPNRVSEAGAVGLMQLMPGTAKHLGVDPRKPDQAIGGAVRHLKWLLSLFDGDRVKAVAAYNAGHVPVQRLGRVPNYPETVVYVAEVFANYEELTGRKVDYSAHLTPKARRWAERAVARRDADG